MALKDYAETVFAEAIAIASPQARAAFLDQACQADPAVRAEVERLVADYFRAGDFLEQPVAQIVAPEIDPSPLACLGTRIGPYKLLEQLGEGGMGVVYLAEQQEPVARRVALKIIKPGMDTQQVIARFEGERQALALMDHPNIAKVFDAGTTDSGRPYFVMELVNGIPVTQFCDQQHLTARERLELFIPICQAVQHAHQKGIIHRDIKPSNILIALYDSRPVPKVIDFGVAKAVSQKLTDKTVFTSLEQIVGTMEYMSPEQAQRKQLDIDTRTDVYSLGVVLYELLAGDTPFDKQRLRSAAWDEMLRIIREEEPPKPSTKLSSSDTLPSVAANRRIEPGKLSALVRGELDWIVMKALEKDRARRYETASALAEDVQHYLHDEAVVACPPSTAYRFKKFARRNKAVLGTSALIALALLVGTTVSVWQASEAHRARRDAEANFRMARKAVDDTLKTLAEEPRLKEAELHELRRDLLTSVLPFYEAFIKQQSDDPELEAARATVYNKLSALHKELMEPEAAITSADAAAEIAARLSAAHPEEPSYGDLQATSLIGKGAVLNDLLGKQTEAIAEFQAARELLEPLASAFPGTAEYQKDLANVYHNLGVVLATQSKLADAEAAQRKAVTIWQTLVAADPSSPENRAELAANRDRLAEVLSERRQLPEALQELRAGLELHEKLAVEFPDRLEYRSASGDSRQSIGVCYHRMGDWVRAETQYRAALELQKTVIADFPHLRGLRSGLTHVHSNLIMVLRAQGKFAEAEEQYRSFAGFWEFQVAQYPHLPEYRQRLLHTHENLGEVLCDQGKFAEATAEFLIALKHGASLVELYPGRAEYQQDIAACHGSLADVYRRMEKPAEALAEIQACMQIRQTLVTQNPEVPAYREDLAAAHDELGILRMTTGKFAEARAAYERSLQLYQALVADFRDVPTYLRGLAGAHVKLGVLADNEHNDAQASVEYRQAQEILQQAASSLAATPDFLVELGGSFCNIGNSLRADQRPTDALEFYGQAVATLEAVLAKEPQLPFAQKFLTNAYAGRALALSELDRVAESLNDADRALQLVAPADRSYFVLMRARCLARQAAEQATAEVEQLLHQDDDVSTFYDAACFYAQLFDREKDTEKSGSYAARAVELLRQVQSRGYFQDSANLANFSKDPDLDPIRTREDFRQWLSHMEKQDTD